MRRRHRLSRREFLRTASVAAAGAAGVPFILPSRVRAAPPSERVAAAVIGVGGRGRYILGAMLGQSDAQVVAVCDVDRSHRERALKTVRDRYAKGSKDGAFQGARAYNDFREIIARDDIDVVGVGTPDHWHAPISIAAVKSGKDVFCEKPMTLTIKGGRAMADAVRRYGRVLQVGNQRRSSGDIRRMCELVRNGRIGKLLRVDVGCGSRPGRPEEWSPEPVPEGFDYDMWLGPAPWAPYHRKRCHYNFRFVKDYSGGEMTNFGAHFLDVAQWGIGADDTGPVEIEGKGAVHATGLYDVFYKFHVEYTYANGVKIVCTSGRHGVKFTGTDGWISSSNTGEPRSMLRSEIGPNEIRLHRAVGGHMGSLFHAIRTREDPSSPVEAGHRTSTLCHLGNIAMALGRKLHWDPASEEFRVASGSAVEVTRRGLTAAGTRDDEANRMTWRPCRHPWKLSV